MLTGKEGLIELGGHALTVINVDIDQMPSLTAGDFPWELMEDVCNLAKILPYVPDLEERERIEDRLIEMTARGREDLEQQQAKSVQTNPVQILKRGTTLAEAARQEKTAATAPSKQSKSKADETRRAQNMKRGALLPRSYPFIEAAGPPPGNVNGFAPAWTRRQRATSCAPKPSTSLPLIPE